MVARSSPGCSIMRSRCSVRRFRFLRVGRLSGSFYRWPSPLRLDPDLARPRLSFLRSRDDLPIPDRRSMATVDANDVRRHKRQWFAVCAAVAALLDCDAEAEPPTLHVGRCEQSGPTGRQMGARVMATIIGGGNTRPGVTGANQLLEAKAPMRSDATCSSRLRRALPSIPNQTPRGSTYRSARRAAFFVWRFATTGSAGLMRRADQGSWD